MKYVALLRGIMPSNPNMKSGRLKRFFEDLGLKNVTTVIASGNIIFESTKANIQTLEEKIEKELPEKLGFNSTTIIRSQKELKKLVAKNPFKGVLDKKPNYLVVTFFKDRKAELATVIDLNESKTTEYMSKVEKDYGKEITTRTWKTIHRILKRMAETT